MTMRTRGRRSGTVPTWTMISGGNFICVLSCLAATAVAFAPINTPKGGIREIRRQRRAGDGVDTGTCCFSTITKKETIPWTQNTEAYGAFDQEDWGWVYSTVPPEACSTYTVEPSQIEGTLPTDLVGTLYRVGPGNFERNGVRYAHALDGDGFVAAFNFEGDGNVQYTGRFVETEYFRAEQEQDQILYRNVFGTQPSAWWKNIANVNLKNVANTNILQWGGRLLVLWEGGRPYELDPVTLETLDHPCVKDESEWGPFENLGQPEVAFRGVTIDEGGDIDTKLNFGRSFTAHPHVVLDKDSKTQTLVGIKAALNPMEVSVKMEIVEYDKEWNEKLRTPYTLAQAPSAPHDFSISKSFYCLVQNRLGLDNLPFLLGLKSPSQVLELSVREPSILHLIPKDKGKEAMQFELPPYFNLHNVPTAIETDDDKLILFSNGWDLADERYFPADQEKTPFLGSWGGRYPDFRFVPPSHLFRTIVDLRKNVLISHEEVIPGLVMEFPTQDDYDNDRVYFNVACTDNTSLPGTGVGQLDVNNPEDIQYWYAEPKIFTGEVNTVPKRNGEKGSWLLTMLYDYAEKRASLAILDSERFSDGPVCRIHLKHPLAYGLHGSFAER
jgi:all-trans-8'-apo-beta-carotenal 15,15'-oxygenase